MQLPAQPKRANILLGKCGAHETREGWQKRQGGGIPYRADAPRGLMTVASDIRKRLLYAKYLLSRAKNAQTERNELGVAVSLLLMHDAAELLMLAIADHLQLGQTWKFMEFWAKVKESGKSEPPHKIPMGQLNNLRVGLKHKGNLPHSQTVRDLLPRVEAFCEELTKTYLDLDFADLSLAELVANEEVRNILRNAKQAFSAGKKDDAFTKLRVAFDKLYGEVAKEVPLIRKKPTVHVSPRKFPPELQKVLEALQEPLEQSVAVLNVLMIGIDPVKYRFFMSNTPHVSWLQSGDYRTVLWRTYDNVSENVFEACFDFVVEVSLKISEVFRPSSLQPQTAPSD